MDTVTAQLYDSFAKGKPAYVGAIGVEASFASRKTTTKPIDHDDLVNECFNECTQCRSQMLVQSDPVVGYLCTAGSVM
ncbi:hypothetical protein K470DRAFT_255540 [Piedraia hortae CBS 480.64]|uniref:Uncharacterized protein n=1 Tax=Piedraia hortae CBS 480.64 TaxID=1314780 RepID=A0A6A7C7I7_9PEZI|nr:hypothetical protein K470DRAFT_255540 [Piedraia hortae CBS 480.64]